MQEKDQSSVKEPPYLSVIIPAYNEAERLPLSLIEWDAYLKTLGKKYELIVVDDGSIDRTSEIVELMKKDIDCLDLITLRENQGKGAAVKEGMLSARGRLRLFADADNATVPSEFPKLEEAIKKGADVAFGSRGLPESELLPSQSWYRSVLGKLGNYWIQIVNLPRVKDSQCGFKVFTSDAAVAVFTETKIMGWGFDIEALVIAKQAGLVSEEIPVVWRNKAGSLVTPQAYLQTLLETLKIRINVVRSAYPKW